MVDFPTPEFPVKARQFSMEQFPHRLHPQPGFGAGAQYGDPRLPVDLIELVCRIQITLGKQHQRFHALCRRNGSHPVNQEGLCYRIDTAAHHHQHIHIGYRRPDKAVLPGQDLL